MRRIVLVTALSFALTNCTEVPMALGNRPLTLVDAWEGAPATAQAGQAVTPAPRFRVVDDAGRPQAGVRVNVVSVRGNGSLPSFATTDADGYASVVWTMQPKEGVNELLAYLPFASDGSSITYTLNALGGTPVSFALTIPDASAIQLGSTRNAAVELRDAASIVLAPRTTIVYSTSDADVATVSADGLVTSVGRGTVDIIATHGALADTVTASVISPAPVIVSNTFAATASYGIAFTQARVALMASPSTLLLARFDAAGLTMLSPILDDFSYIDVAVSPDSSMALASIYENGRNELLELSLPTGPGTRIFTLPHAPLRVRYAPDGLSAYATMVAGGVAKIDLATGSVTTLNLSGNAFNGIALSADGATLFISEQEGRVYRIDAATFTSTGFAMVGGTPQGIALSADGGRLFVSRRDGELLVLSSSTLVQVGAGPLAGGGFDVLLSPDGFYVIVVRGALASVYDERTLFHYQSLGTGSSGRRGAIEPGTGAVWITTDGSRIVRLSF